ncbi:short-chain dehydrogenase [Amycolatopsis antarctica]|uniref:Short-chain dehydrogenase n=1 Tax=Amycolatopsis antarctica TaxID=1854586 RepID=A0A263D9T1_9PSEU|nr:SDR family NAD(P)-dependent oxidoreductase [Amycolatopsis antarctica]OZM75292.1 short-chain dehydrogenase [Amycolatopsis antarctica]
MHAVLAGHTALVTGSSGGIGSAIAERLAAGGCAVLVHGRDPASAEPVAGRIRRAGGRATVVLGDLAVAEQAGEVAAAALGHGVDVLVANAGPFRENTWDTAESADWGESYDGNVLSAVRLIQALTPSMRERGWGRVVTVASRAVTTPLANMVTYSAAKAAVVNLTVGLAGHLAGSGVTANCVSPGVILTPSLRRMFLDRTGDPHAEWPAIEGAVTADYAPNPSGRLGRPEDIAHAVAFLVDPRAGYVNGTELRVDGGITGAV